MPYIVHHTSAITRLATAAAMTAVMALCNSCEKELDFDYHDISPLTVIEGKITQHGTSVGITLTTPMDEPMDTRHLTDAEVTLTDLADNTTERLMPDAEGVFTSATTGIIGHTYRLDVAHETGHFSSTSTMLPPSEITGMRFGWIKMPYDEVAVLEIDFTDNTTSDGDCFWIRVYRNGEPYRWGIATDVTSAGENGLTMVFMTTRHDTDEADDDDVLFDGDEVSAKVTPVSREMYDYLMALTLTGSNGPQMFEGDFCLGYFLASPESTASVIFNMNEIPDAG